MPDASLSSLAYKLASLQRTRKRDNSSTQDSSASEPALQPSESAGRLPEAQAVTYETNASIVSMGVSNLITEKSSKPHNTNDRSTFPWLDNGQLPLSSFYGSSSLLSICESCGCAHDGLYGSGRFCSKHCAKGVGARCKWSMVKAASNSNTTKEEHNSLIANSRIPDSTSTSKIRNEQKVGNDDPLKRLCALAENEKRILSGSPTTCNQTNYKKNLYKYQLQQLELQQNSQPLEAYTYLQGHYSEPIDLRRSSKQLYSPILDGNQSTRSIEGSSEKSHSLPALGQRTYEHDVMQEEEKRFAVQHLLNESFASVSETTQEELIQLPPFYLLKKAAEEGDMRRRQNR